MVGLSTLLGDFEAVSWDGDRIVLTNEQSEIFRISRSRWLRQQAPFLRRPEESIPFVNERFSVHLSLDEWPRGRWLRSRFPEEARLLGRVNWSSEGLHIGLELPSDVELSTVDPRLAEDTDQWFLPGIVYLMVNPDGHRPLTYGENDRCVVFTPFSQ